MKVIIAGALIALLIFIAIAIVILREIGKAEEEFYEYQREYEKYE